MPEVFKPEDFVLALYTWTKSNVIMRHSIWKKQDYPIKTSVRILFNDGNNTIGEKLYGSTDFSKELHYDVMEKGGKRLLGWALRPNQKYADFLDGSIYDISQFRDEGTVKLYS